MSKYLKRPILNISSCEGKNIKPEVKRFVALEGVRGLAAIIVVFHHFFLAFYPVLVFGPGDPQHTRFEDNIHNSPLALIYAGTFAVAIFFVLSGFVLTIGFFQTKSEKIIKKLASKRYLRLMLPALAVTMLSLMLIKLGFAHNITEVAKITGSSWLAGTWSFNANFLDALYSGTVGIFVQGGSPYDNVLWTMLTEFIGSFIVFAFVLLFGRSRHRWVSYVAMFIFTFNTWFLPFIVGMALADLYASGYLEVLKKKRWVTGALLGAIAFGSFPAFGASSTTYGLFSKQIFTNINIDYKVLYLTLGASLLIFAVLISKRLSGWLEKPRVSNLGKYTFSLYLIHLLVLYTVGTSLFLFLSPHFGYNTTVAITIPASLIVVVFATMLFERYVDAPAVRFSGVVARIFENDESFGFKKYATRIRRRVQRVQGALLRRPRPAEEPLVEQITTEL